MAWCVPLKWKIVLAFLCRFCVYIYYWLMCARAHRQRFASEKFHIFIVVATVDRIVNNINRISPLFVWIMSIKLKLIWHKLRHRLKLRLSHCLPAWACLGLPACPPTANRIGFSTQFPSQRIYSSFSLAFQRWPTGTTIFIDFLFWSYIRARKVLGNGFRARVWVPEWECMRYLNVYVILNVRQ